MPLEYVHDIGEVEEGRLSISSTYATKKASWTGGWPRFLVDRIVYINKTLASVLSNATLSEIYEKRE